MQRPTPTQAEAIRALIDHGGVIERWKGGFWTYRGCKVKYHVAEADGGYNIPAWHASTGTVNAMVKKGWLERMHKHAESFRDDHRLTDAGRAMAEG